MLFTGSLTNCHRMVDGEAVLQCCLLVFKYLYSVVSESLCTEFLSECEHKKEN